MNENGLYIYIVYRMFWRQLQDEPKNSGQHKELHCHIAIHRPLSCLFCQGGIPFSWGKLNENSTKIKEEGQGPIDNFDTVLQVPKHVE